MPFRAHLPAAWQHILLAICVSASAGRAGHAQELVTRSVRIPNTGFATGAGSYVLAPRALSPASQEFAAKPDLATNLPASEDVQTVSTDAFVLLTGTTLVPLNSFDLSLLSGTVENSAPRFYGAALHASRAGTDMFSVASSGMVPSAGTGRGFEESARTALSEGVELWNLASLFPGTAQDSSGLFGELATANGEDLAAPPLRYVRARLIQACRTRDLARIRQLRSAMLLQSDRTVDDDLLCVATAPTEQERHAELAYLCRQVAGDRTRVLAVAEWMIAHGSADDALQWLREMPAARQNEVAIESVEADALTALRDWRGLHNLLTGRSWDECDFMRVAMLVRCTRESDLPGPNWSEAIGACRADGRNLLLLAQVAVEWSWRDEAEALYWQVAAPGCHYRSAALDGLWAYYSRRSDARGLLRVARERFDDHPGDPVARNNFAFLALLSGHDRAQPAQIAAEDFEVQPDNANVAATYAFALYLDGRYEEGLRVLNHIGEDRLRDGGTFLYLALLQQASGQLQAAAHSASGVDPGKLLPEERILLQRIGRKTS